MNRGYACRVTVVTISGLFLLAVLCPLVQAGFMENFDGGGSVPFAFTNTTGSPGAIMGGGGPTGNFARLANLNGSNNNSIAFDEAPTQTGPAPNGLKLAFNFRMTGDQANDAAGGCCGSAADGLGIGLFSTATYGTTGAINPADGGGNWERPAFADAFTVGLDIFQNIDVVSLNWGGAEVAAADVQASLDLNDDKWDRAVVTVRPSGSDAVVDMDIIADVMGSTTVHNIFSGQVIPGLDLANLPGYRVIGGGRTGGAFHDGDFDNISLVSIPEPAGIVLLGLGTALLLVLRRRSS